MIDKLARGMRRSLNREIKDTLEKRWEEYNVQSDSQNLSRKAWEKQTLKQLKKLTENYSLGMLKGGLGAYTAGLGLYTDGLGIFKDENNPKKPLYNIFYMDRHDHIDGRVAIQDIEVNTRNFTVVFYTLPISVSSHAIERVFQRLRYISHNEAMNEIGEAIVNLLFMQTAIGELLVPSPHGAFLGYLDGDLKYTLTTFVNDEKLSSSQHRSKNNALTANPEFRNRFIRV